MRASVSMRRTQRPLAALAQPAGCRCGCRPSARCRAAGRAGRSSAGSRARPWSEDHRGEKERRGRGRCRATMSSTSRTLTWRHEPPKSRADQKPTSLQREQRAAASRAPAARQRGCGIGGRSAARRRARRRRRRSRGASRRSPRGGGGQRGERQGGRSCRTALRAPARVAAPRRRISRSAPHTVSTCASGIVPKKGSARQVSPAASVIGKSPGRKPKSAAIERLQVDRREVRARRDAALAERAHDVVAGRDDRRGGRRRRTSSCASSVAPTCAAA